MDRAKIVETLRDIVADQTGIVSFDNDETLAETGLDSLDIVELVLAVEDEFGIYIDDEDLTEDMSINSVASLVVRLRA